jgi:hypothetical protein
MLYCICENFVIPFHFGSGTGSAKAKIPDTTFSHSIVQKLFNLSGEALPTADQIDLFHNFLHKLSLLVICLPLAVHLDVKNFKILKCDSWNASPGFRR